MGEGKQEKCNRKPSKRAFHTEKTFCRTFLSFHHTNQTITGIKLKDMRNKHERNDNHETNTDKRLRQLSQKNQKPHPAKKYLLV